MRLFNYDGPFPPETLTSEPPKGAEHVTNISFSDLSNYMKDPSSIFLREARGLRREFTIAAPNATSSMTSANIAAQGFAGVYRTPEAACG